MPTSSLPAVFIFSFVMGFGAVVSPGPVSTAIVSQAPRRGWTVGPLIAIGHSVMELVIIVMIGIGLTSGMANPSVQIVIAIIGGLLLVWMGGNMLQGVREGKVKLPGIVVDSEELLNHQLIVLGIVTTLSNPFWYAWWVTVAAGYLAQAQTLGIASVAAFFLGHISADFAWDTALSSVISGGRNWINDSVYTWIMAICAVFFIYLGGSFILRGINLVPQI